MIPASKDQQLRLVRLSQHAKLPVRDVLRLVRADLGTPDALVGYDDATVIAYAIALVDSADRSDGVAPPSWRRACECAGCGPVWLWYDSPKRVRACPWCANRLAGLPIPRPPSTA